MSHASVAHRLQLAVIVPVHNEAGALPAFHAELTRELGASGLDHRVLYVDDGSTDASASILADLGATVVSLGMNRGYGAALKTGILNTDSEWVAIIDADRTYRPEDLVRLCRSMETCDMAVGQRPPEKGLRRLAKGFLHAVANYAVDARIPDINSGLRVFKREVALSLFKLLPNGFSFTSTITLGSFYTPYRVRYLPIAYDVREGESKIRPFDALFNFTLLILRTMVLWAPLKFFLPASGLLGSLGLGFLIRDLMHQDVAQGSLLLLTNAFTLFAIGLLAEASRARN